MIDQNRFSGVDDDPAGERRWLAGEHRRALEYLANESVEHGGIPDDPAWFVAPYVALWPVGSRKNPGVVGWWVITGDLPATYISAQPASDPASALREFAQEWRAVAIYMLRGEAHPDVSIGSPEDWPELGNLLLRRAELLEQCAERC